MGLHLVIASNLSGLHRPNEPLSIEVRDGKEYPTCALDLTPTYAVVSSCISFYVPCVVLVGIYSRWAIFLNMHANSSFKNFSYPLLSLLRLYCYAQKHVRSIRAVTKTRQPHYEETLVPPPPPPPTQPKHIHYSPKRRCFVSKKNLINRNSHQLGAYNTSDRKAAVTVGVIMGTFLGEKKVCMWRNDE